MARNPIGGRVEGLEEARRALQAVISAEQASIPGALELIGQQAVTEIRRYAPVDTGTLRRSYGWETGSEGRRSWLEVSTNVVYAPFQEFGTSRSTGTPHVRPGVEAVTDLVPQLIAEAAGRAGMSAVRGGGGFGNLARRLGSFLGGGGGP